MNHKIVLIGSFAVGKTSLIRRLITGKFVTDPEPTIGCGFYRYTSKSGIAFDLWDTAGQERFMSIMPFYIRGADAILFTFDVSCPQSLQDIHTKWIPFVEKHTDIGTPMRVLVENKSDLATPHDVNCTSDSDGSSTNITCEVPLQTPQEIAAEHSMRHYRASPLLGTGIVEIFDDLERLLPRKPVTEIVETCLVPQCSQSSRCCG